MLNAVRLKNFRAYTDTKDVEFSKLNVFIGANNAGKSSLLSSVEIFLRSRQGGGITPLVFSEMPALASFDAILRKHWSPKEQRPKKIGLEYLFSASGSDRRTVRIGFECGGNNEDGATRVEKISYDFGSNSGRSVLTLDESSVTDNSYYIAGPRGGKSTSGQVFFHNLIPFSSEASMRDFRKLATRLMNDIALRPVRLEVVHPFRPVPKSFYFIDDPGMTSEDRDLLTYLIKLWGSKDKNDREIKDRIIASMDMLGLSKDFGVTPISKKTGPKIFEIRVSPSNKRQNVTIADAGFGLSQVLPLVVYDARLSNGYLVAYQPELHLHPRAQARLADVFVHSVKRGNQVFVESHSPDMIMRLQLLMTQGVIDSSDVAVFCLENGSGKASVRQIKFDSLGVPEGSWPSGFLDSSINLARELNSARFAKSHAAGGVGASRKRGD